MATNFELSYAGVQFLIPDAATVGVVERWLQVEDAREAEWDTLQFSGRSAARLSVPEYRIPGWLGLYKLYLPSSARKFGVFRGLVSSADMATMVASEVASGMWIHSGYSTHLLVMRTEKDATPIKVRMLMLPPKPLVGLNGLTDLYLVTLVDERYFWSWQSPGTGVTSDSASFSFYDSWEDLVEFLPDNGNALSTILFESAVSGTYGKPEADSDLYSFGDSCAGIIDSAMYNTGRVVCPCLTSGILCIPATQGVGFWAVTWSEANTHLQTVKTALASRKVAGGSSWAESGLDSIRARVLPASVTVDFPCWRDGSGYECGPDASNGSVPEGDRRSWSGGSGMTLSYRVTVTAASLGSPYWTYATTPQTSFQMRDTARALNCDADGVPENFAELTLLATQMARDFYDHQLLSTDACYNGLVQAWSYPHGLDVIWDYLASTTRIACPGPHRHPTEMQHGFGLREAPKYDTSVTTTHPSGVTVTVDHGFLPENLPYGGAAESLFEITLEPGTYVIELDASFSYGVSGGAGTAGVQSYWTLASGSCKGVPPSSKIEFVTGLDDTSYTVTVPQHWSFVAIVLTDSVLNFYGMNYGGATSVSAFESGYPKITTLK